MDIFLGFQFHALQIKGFLILVTGRSLVILLREKKSQRDFKKLCFPVEKSSLFWQDFLIMNKEKNNKSERCRDIWYILSSINPVVVMMYRFLCSFMHASTCLTMLTVA